MICQKTMNKGSILAAGYTTRHVVRSAARAGYTVYAVDHFCDEDLIPYCADHLAFDEVEELPFAVDAMLKKHDIDYVVTTSGAELLDLPKRLGTAPQTAAPFMDKGATQAFFEKTGVPVPELLLPGIYPAMLKTTSGSGGWRNALVRNEDEEKTWCEFVENVPYLRQKFIEGQPASVCCLGTPDGRAMVLTTNEQILRGGETCQYAFSGSVTPCSHPMAARMKETGEKIAAACGCVGTFGIDFVLTEDEAYAIEINPRFQGTVETVEQSLGINIFKLHKAACEGVLPKTAPAPKQYAVRKILAAPHDLTLKADLSVLADFITDIPSPGTFFEEGEVMFSVTASGKTREDALERLHKNISLAIQHIS
ncbi:MAG TPA: ATP-grasp domain-containing protein [Methanocorpusculum sp.]|nr:ATP-grasp domain-containing protein [Methanocorpusculum sp.]